MNTTTTDKLSGAQLTAALKVVRHCFPQYAGRKVYVHVSDREMDLISHWDSGHKDEYKGLNLTNGQAIAVPQNGTMFDGPNARGIKYTPRPGVAIVQFTRSGQNKYAAIWLHPADTGNRLLTAS